LLFSMVQRKGKNETASQNGVSNGHINGKGGNKGGKSVKAKAVPVKEDSDSEQESVLPAMQANGNVSEKAEARKRTSSVGKTATLGERKAALNVGSTSEWKGDSMAFLLTQGLMANDASKIDTVLEKTNPNVIQATLAELPTAEVIPLLKAIEIRLRTRKALDIRPWIRWAQCCLSLHLPYLSSQPSLETSLGGLLDWMRNRTSHMQKLLALHGKMNVFVEEMEKRRGGRNWNGINTISLVIFNEEDGKSDEEMDSMSGDEEDGATSEEDWWDDGGVAATEGEEESDDDDEGAESGDEADDNDSEEEDGEDQVEDEGSSDEDMDV
ncbi:hypothetical protein PENTCL1PPCAC_2334, partial [Pristionchus entomophagus]